MIRLTCVGGPFDGQFMPRPEKGDQFAFPNFLLKQWDAMAEPGATVGRLIEASAETSGNASLYRVDGEALVFVSVISKPEYLEWATWYDAQD